MKWRFCLESLNSSLLEYELESYFNRMNRIILNVENKIN